MAARLPGEPSRRPGSLRFALLAGVIALAFAVPALAASAKKPAKPAPAVKTAVVPLPYPSPQRTASAPADPPAASSDPTDAIGALIADGGDEEKATEDSDAPEAARTPPDLGLGLPPMPPPKGAPPANATGLQLAVKLLDNNDPGGAMAAAYALPDKLDLKLVDWLIATGGYAGVPSGSIASLQRQVADWPGQSLIRLRFEQALKREQPGSAGVIAALSGSTPVSDDGKIMLAAAYLEQGRNDAAAAIIRPFWRDSDFPQATETAVVSKFGSLLTAADHKARMDRLLYADNSAAGLRTAAHLDKNQQALAKAVALQIKGSSTKAMAALDALPAALKRDPLWIYTKVDALRTLARLEDAGKLIQTAPRDAKALEDPDTWWVERRLLSRALVTAGDARLAYQIAASHSAESAGMKAEAEFHAGWYALEYLHDPVSATSHFANIAAISTLPLSLSRAEYWLGRSAEAAGDRTTAAAQYQQAAAYPTTFYGQLAISKLGGKVLRLPPAPAPSDVDRRNFEARELVKVIRRLEAVDYDDRTPIFFRTLADQITSPGEIALLTGLAEGEGNHQLALQLAKTAVSHGVPVDALAFPTTAIPQTAATPGVDRAVVFAVARQESAFNPGAISSAGARGLLQLMPATAKITAKAVGLPYDKSRLTSDPGYNATLGAAHLGDLVQNFGGSYVMTFAAYNAGASRVNQWVQQYGDPRDPKTDVVNWIESIPFTETRNYVQRLMENLEVYRARFGSSALTIDADLHRGQID